MAFDAPDQMIMPPDGIEPPTLVKLEPSPENDVALTIPEEAYIVMPVPT